MEELVAEIRAAFLCAEPGITPVLCLLRSPHLLTVLEMIERGFELSGVLPRCDESRPADLKRLVRIGHGGCLLTGRRLICEELAAQGRVECDTQRRAGEAMARRGRSVYTPIDCGYVHGRNAWHKRIFWIDCTRGGAQCVFEDLCRGFERAGWDIGKRSFDFRIIRRNGISWSIVITRHLPDSPPYSTPD